MRSGDKQSCAHKAISFAHHDWGNPKVPLMYDDVLLGIAEDQSQIKDFALKKR